MENDILEGFIYDCSSNGIRTIYCSVIGEIWIDKMTEVFNRNRKPKVGMWCKFKPFCQKDGKWFARTVVLMTYPRLKYLIKENECIVKGIAVVCNINDDSGYLWNDYIGMIAVEGQMAYQLKPLTVVEFQAVPLRKDGTLAYFTAKEINADSENIFQSEVLIFVQKAEVKADGRAHVSDCVITVLDTAYSTRPTSDTTMSILYYKVYNNTASGVGIYATTNSNIVAGIRDDFFTTKLCLEKYAGTTELEQFEDACENLKMISDRSQVFNDEIADIKIDMSDSPIESIIEFAETDENHHSSAVVLPLADNNNCSMDQSFQSCSSRISLVPLADDNSQNNCSMNQNFQSSSSHVSLILDSKLNSDDKFSSNVPVKKDDPELASSSKGDIVADIEMAEAISQLRMGSEEDVWDNEFIEHVLLKVKEVQRTEGGRDRKYNVSETHDNSGSNKDERCDELKDRVEDRCASMQHIQSNKTEDIKNDMKLGNDTGSSPRSSSFNRVMGKMDLKLLTNPGERISVGKSDSTWIDEVDELCIKVLSNARLRNFVSVNKNGNALLCDIMLYLENELTVNEVNEELGISFSEVTEERALKICRKFMKMNGFELFANCQIPKIPEEIR